MGQLEEVIFKTIADNGVTAVFVFWLLTEGRREFKDLVAAFNSLAESFKKISNLNERLDRIESTLEKIERKN